MTRVVQEAVLGALCIGLTAAAYAPTLALPPMAEWYVEHEAAADGFRWNEAVHPRGPYYRPATRWAYALAREWGDTPDHPRRDRAIVLAVHLGCVWMLFARLRATGSLAVAAALALGFGLHPALTASVVCSSAWWTVLLGLLFLGAAALYDVDVTRTSGTGVVARSVAAATVLLLMMLLGESGVAAAAAIAIGIALRARPGHAHRLDARLLLPAVVAILSYGILRAVAMGTSVLQSYVAPPPTVAAWLLMVVRNLGYEATSLMSPLRAPFIDLSDGGSLAVLLSVAGLGGLAACAAWPPARALVRDHPLPAVALCLHGLLQINANWLVAKPPIGKVGIDRSFHQYLPALFLYLLAGPALTRLSAAWPVRARRALAGTIGLWLAWVALAHHHAVRLAVAGGDILRSDRRALEPFLRTLPPETSVITYGFPDELRAPHLPWVWLYSFSRAAIFSHWAGRAIHIAVPPYGDHAPPEGFGGYILMRTEAGILWARQNPGATQAEYLRAHEGRTETTPVRQVPIDRGRSRGVADAHVTDGAFHAHAVDADPSLSFQIDANSADYGVLRYELQAAGGTGATQAYFRAPAETLHESRSMVRAYDGDGAWHEVRFPLFADPRWAARGRIEEIRIDPVDRPVPFAIRGVRLENDLEWARCWAAP